MLNNMIDNIDIIRNFLDFPDEDTFYFLQIMIRKKDVSTLNAYNRVIQSYYIHSKEDFDNKIDEIKKICNLFHARAYINLNQKSFEKSAFYCMKELSDLIINKDFYHAKSVFNSVCGKYSIGGKKKLWVIDIDTKDEYTINKISKFIKTLQPLDTEKVVMTVPTVNGVHLISKTFDLMSFKKEFSQG